MSSFWAPKQEEKVSFNLPEFDYEDDNDDGKSTDIEVAVCVHINVKKEN